MTESQVQATEGSRRPRRWRYLIDIVVLVAVTFLLDALLGAFIPVPINLERAFVFDAIGKMLLVGVAWGLIRLRGERLADIGLKRPASWTRTCHRNWLCCYCFRRHISFGKGGVSS